MPRRCGQMATSGGTGDVSETTQLGIWSAVLLALIWLAVRLHRNIRNRRAEIEQLREHERIRRIVADSEAWSRRRVSAAQPQQARGSSSVTAAHCPTQPHAQMTYGAVDSGCSGGSSDSGGSCSSD